MTKMNPAKYPIVSIIVPCYNQAQYLPMTLDSVIAQTFDNWECIIVNDGATDNTENVALTYCNKDSRFVYYKQENKGLSAARNVGIRLSKGDYLQFLDSDDILAPQKLEKQVAIMQDSVVDVCTCHHDMFNDEDFENRYTYPLSEARQNFTIKDLSTTFLITPHDSLCKKCFLEEHNITFVEKLRSIEDWLFYATLIVKGAKFVEINEILAHYRIHQDSMSKQQKTMCVSSIQAAFYLYDLIPQDSREEYIQYESVRQIDRILLLMQYKYWSRYRDPIDFKLGNALLKPFRIIKKILRIVKHNHNYENM